MNTQRALLALVLAGSLAALVAPAKAQMAEQVPPPRIKWSFSGPFGKYDEGQLQRGLKVYKEVCSSCHSMEMLTFGNLADAGGPGFTEGQAEALAGTYKISDLDDKGQPMERAGRLADHFPSPFPNTAAAAAANGKIIVAAGTVSRTSHDCAAPNAAMTATNAAALRAIFIAMKRMWPNMMSVDSSGVVMATR